MPSLEVQFQESVFFEILRAQVVRLDLPRGLFAGLGSERLYERVDAGAAGFARPEDNLPIPDADAGQLTFRLPFTQHHTSLAAARAAGSLQPPASQQINGVAWVRLAAVPPSDPLQPVRLRYSLVFLLVEGQQKPAIGGDVIDLGDLGLPVKSLGLFAGDGVVALRFGAGANDDLAGPVTSRLAGKQWGAFVEGQVFATQLAQEFNAAVKDTADSDPDLELVSQEDGHWSVSPPYAYTSVEVLALRAIPVIKTDVPVRLLASAELQPNALLNRLRIRTTLRWFAHDFITNASSGAIEKVQDDVSDAVVKKFKPPASQHEVERTRDHVVLESDRPLPHLRTALFTATVDHAVADGSGLVCTGYVSVALPPVAHFTFEPPHWSRHEDCHAKRMVTEFVPPTVHIFAVDRFISLKFRSTPLVNPDGFWTPHFGWSGFGPGNQIAHVTFDSWPLGMPPGGQSSSAYFDTNCGMRWVDLGVRPYEPPAVSDPLSEQVHVISNCMAISDRWGMGVLNLDWLVDPPTLDLGMPLVREWTVVAENLREVELIDLVALGPKVERPLGSFPLADGAIFAQVITDADEQLSIRPSRPMVGATPQVLQRWIVPWNRLAAPESLTRIDLRGRQLLAIGETQRPLKWDLGSISSGAIAVDDAALEREWTALLTRSASRGRMVAALYRGAVLLGFAGPTVSVLGRPELQPHGRSPATP